jgi:hypothetical protein
MFDWLRILFKRKPTVTVKEVGSSGIGEVSRFKTEVVVKPSATLESNEPPEKQIVVTNEVNPINQYLARPQTATEINKILRNMEIAKRNQQRQQNTLGYGVRGKFKPRSHFEKTQWKLDKKPSEEDD